ncbi:MAG: hypothetical protein GF364_19220 [Candidatus Lokiarchaeota archaeon]|nr:hypothetical protein [Candidatus Lokiarchaeota archaeon]
MREEVDFQEAVDMYQDDPTIILEPWGMTISHLRLIIKGIPDTPYDRGSFVFEIKMPENYPYYPPYVYAHTLMWHPNIDSSIPPGKLNICLDLINPDLIGTYDVGSGASGWVPTKTLSVIIEALKGMMHCEFPFFNPQDPLNFEAGEQAQHAYHRFVKKAKEWTEKYAID